MDASSFFQYPGDPAPAADAAMMLLRNATTADWQRLMAHCSTRRFAAGDWLISIQAPLLQDAPHPY